MKITVTKKEFEAANELLKSMYGEIAKDKTLNLIDSEDLPEYSLDTLESSNGKWGKIKITKPNTVSNNRMVIDINEECLSELIETIYNPFVIKCTKWMLSTYKTFSSIFKQLEKSFDKFFKKWIE